MGRLTSIAAAARSTLADDVLDGLTRAGQGAAAQAPLRRARLGALRPHLRAARVLPDARGAGDPRGARRRHRRRHRRRRARRAGRRAPPPRRACCSTPWRGPARCGATCRSTSTAAWCATPPRRCAAEYPGLEVHGVTGDFEHDLDEIPPPEPGRPRIVAFLGGTIGNFIPGSRRRFLRELGARLDDDSFLLLGTDLVKDPAVLEAAYDDSQGVTAEFNLNMLRVLNRELDADFDVDNFEHVAFYDEQREWIEMRLRARRAHSVRVGGDRPRPRVRPRRGAADRDLGQVHARARARRPRRRRARARRVAHRPGGALRALAQPESTGSSAPSLTSVSASSAAGSESRTTPTPA